MYQHKAVGYASGGVAGIFLYAALIFHEQGGPWPLFLIIGLLLGLTTYFWFRSYYRIQRQTQLRSEWGKELSKKRDEGMIREHFDRGKSRPGEFSVDDRTWQDLGMDDLYAFLDRTRSFCGQQILYTVLRSMVQDPSVLISRGVLITGFSNDTRGREQVVELLDRIGLARDESIVSLLWDELPIKPAVYAPLFPVLALLAAASLVAPVLLGLRGILLLLVVFALNMAVHYREQKRITVYFSSLRAVSRLLYYSRILTRQDIPWLRKQQQILQENLNKVPSFVRTVSNVGVESTDPMTGSILQYMNILLLTEVRGFFKAQQIIRTERPAFQAIFETVGYLDTCQAAASFRHSLPFFAEPKFQSEKGIQCVDMYHPLIENPVPNSASMSERGMLITGSNMSGKTTYLRVLGISVLLAQTLFTSCSRAHSGSVLKLMSSIDRSDNLKGQESYYLVEAKSVLRILRELKREGHSLCLLDEIFRGTNSDERIAAACRVLEYLAQSGGLAVVATHDLVLTQKLGHLFENVHFSEVVGEAGLQFDYRLKQGPATTRNAISLLEYLGYPQVVTERARSDLESAAGKEYRILD